MASTLPFFHNKKTPQTQDNNPPPHTKQQQHAQGPVGHCLNRRGQQRERRWGDDEHGRTEARCDAPPVPGA